MLAQDAAAAARTSLTGGFSVAATAACTRASIVATMTSFSIATSLRAVTSRNAPVFSSASMNLSRSSTLRASAPISTTCRAACCCTAVMRTSGGSVALEVRQQIGPGECALIDDGVRFAGGLVDDCQLLRIDACERLRRVDAQPLRFAFGGRCLGAQRPLAARQTDQLDGVVGRDRQDDHREQPEQARAPRARCRTAASRGSCESRGRRLLSAPQQHADQRRQRRPLPRCHRDSVGQRRDRRRIQRLDDMPSRASVSRQAASTPPASAAPPAGKDAGEPCPSSRSW